MELPNVGYYIGNIKIPRNLSELGETVGDMQLIVVRGCSIPKLNVEKDLEEVGKVYFSPCGELRLLSRHEDSLGMLGWTSIMRRCCILENLNMKQDPDHRGRTLGSEPVLFAKPPQTVGNVGLLGKTQDMNTQICALQRKI